LKGMQNMQELMLKHDVTIKVISTFDGLLRNLFNSVL
jgi:hypothetical protein